jgi:rhodanese-related sulfurtransferase
MGARGARVVLADDTGVRADATAHWLAQMGWDVYVLEGGVGSGPVEQLERDGNLPFRIVA